MRGRARALLLAVVGLVLVVVCVYQAGSPDTEAVPPAAPAPGGAAVLEAFNARRSGVEVEATGVVARRLADDRKGLPWTHRDPGGRHAPGWIRLRGRLYQ